MWTINRAVFAVGASMALLCAVAIAAEESDEKEEKVELNALPAAVRATAEANAGGGKIVEAELETEDGKKQYSIEVKKENGEELDIEIAPDGKLLKVEKEDAEEGDKEDDDDEKEEKVELSALPAAVRATAEANAGGGKLVEAELETEDGKHIYSVEVKKENGEELEIEIASDGKLLKVEKEEADDDDDEDEGEGKEEKIELSAAPEAVQAAVNKALNGGKLDELVRETEEGAAVYEAEYKVADVAHSLKLSAAGAVLEQENAVSTSTLASDVTAAIKKKFPKGQISEAEEVTLHFYEVDVIVNGKKKEVKVSAAGQIQDDEEDDDDEDEDEDEDEDDEDK